MSLNVKFTTPNQALPGQTLGNVVTVTVTSSLNPDVSTTTSLTVLILDPNDNLVGQMTPDTPGGLTCSGANMLGLTSGTIYGVTAVVKLTNTSGTILNSGSNTIYVPKA
jgi:hypothetical protein